LTTTLRRVPLTAKRGGVTVPIERNGKQHFVVLRDEHPWTPGGAAEGL